jgi:hypothetical protein
MNRQYQTWCKEKIGTDLVRPRERSAGKRGIGETRNAEVR